MVQPEGHPGHADSHEGRDVDGEHVVAELEVKYRNGDEKFMSMDDFLSFSSTCLLNIISTDKQLYRPVAVSTSH